MPRSPEPDRPRPGPCHFRPEEVDRHVAGQLRQLRLLLGLTQQELAERAGVTYQQVNKYETGTNRLSAGRLHGIATALGVEISALFAGLENHPGGQPAPPKAMDELAQDFLRLPSQAQRQVFVALVRTIATTKAPSTD